MFLQRELCTRFSQKNKQADQSLRHDQHAKSRIFEVRQNVMVCDFHPTCPKWLPGIILKQTGPLSFIVQVEHGLTWKRHVDHLHHSISENAPPQSSPIITENDRCKQFCESTLTNDYCKSQYF